MVFFTNICSSVFLTALPAVHSEEMLSKEKHFFTGLVWVLVPSCLSHGAVLHCRGRGRTCPRGKGQSQRRQWLLLSCSLLWGFFHNGNGRKWRNSDLLCTYLLSASGQGFCCGISGVAQSSLSLLFTSRVIQTYLMAHLRHPKLALRPYRIELPMIYKIYSFSLAHGRAGSTIYQV